MRIDTGSYTGDGAGGGQVISGLTNCVGDLSSVDSFVMVVGVLQNAVWTTNTFATGYSRELWSTGFAITGRITALGTAQFTVDGALNANGTVYYYLVLQADGVIDDFETGSYTGNGQDDQTGLVTFESWTPSAVLIGTSDRGNACVGRTTNGGSGLTQMFNAVANNTNRIQALNQGNCEIGTGTQVNGSGSTYHFVVIGDIAGYVDFIEYAGNSTDNRTIATEGSFQPDFVFIMNHGTNIFSKEATTAGVDSSIRLVSSAATADRIQDFVSTGIEVSAHVTVNVTGNDYFAWCFKKYEGASESTLLPIIMNYNQKMRS